jgi:hypothetical protein
MKLNKQSTERASIAFTSYVPLGSDYFQSLNLGVSTSDWQTYKNWYLFAHYDNTRWRREPENKFISMLSEDFWHYGKYGFSPFAREF